MVRLELFWFSKFLIRIESVIFLIGSVFNSMLIINLLRNKHKLVTKSHVYALNSGSKSPKNHSEVISDRTPLKYGRFRFNIESYATNMHSQIHQIGWIYYAIRWVFKSMLSEDLRPSGRKAKIIWSWKTIQQMDLWAI